MEILKWLSNFGPAGIASLREILELISKIRDTEDRAEQIKISLSILKLLAKLSPTTMDDSALEVIDKIASEDLIRQLLSLVNRFNSSSVQVCSAEDLSVATSEFTAQGIGLLQIISIAKTIADLLKMLRD